MLATDAIQTALLDALNGLNRFRAVEAYPLARLTEETFPQDLIKLDLPAALLVFVDDRQSGRPAERRINWLLLVIALGTNDDAANFNLTTADLIRDQVVGQVIAGSAFVFPESRVSALDSSEAYTASAINLTTVEHQ